ncbi:hypothetical protein ABWK22_23475, partial [Gottfriedia acidiceleris]|uniref:hypothetical protein n=1 Tax=Gottfriedia acidiceleris TaxID=371036 RepID=UPI0033947A69
MLKSILIEKRLEIGYIILFTLYLQNYWSKLNYDWHFWLSLSFLILRIPLTTISVIKKYKRLLN